MKLLIVTTNNYPYNGTCSNIISKLLFDGEWAKKDEIEILCSKSNANDPDVEVLDGITVHRVFSYTLIDKKAFKKLAKGSLIHGIKGTIARASYHYQQKIIRSDFIDHVTERAFLRALNEINSKKYDYIISISGRYDASSAVYSYCKAKGIPFVLYQVDPCKTSRLFNDESKNKREKFEHRLIEYASHVFTTPIIYSEYAGLAKYRDKMTTVEFPLIIPSVHEHKYNTPLHFMFLGSFYRGVRDPEATMKLFTPFLRKNQAVLEFVGSNESILNEEQKKLPIICHGRKSIDECNAMIDQTDVLVNIGNRIDNQVPSKILDYISTGKPIINVYVSDNDPALEYLRKYPLAFNIREDRVDSNETISSLEQFLSSVVRSVMNDEEINRLYLECTPEYCAKQICSVLQG